jgi:PAS domain S-box-containing protein
MAENFASSRLISAFRVFALGAGAGVCAVGLAVLVGGWAWGIEALRASAPNGASMRANAALAFVLAGVSLALLARGALAPFRQRMAAGILGVAVGAIGLLTLLQYGGGWNFGIDEALFRDASIQRAGDYPGRMPQLTAFNLALLGIALILGAARRHLAAAQILALVSLATSWGVALAYLFHLEDLNVLEVGMSPASVLCFLALGLGVIHATPEEGLPKLLAEDSLGGAMLRRFLPAVILIPSLFGWLERVGAEEAIALYASETGEAIFVSLTISLLGIAAWWGASHLSRLDIERRRADEVFRQLLERAPDAMVIADQSGAIHLVNAQAERLFGYAREEMIGQPVELLIPERLRKGHIALRSAYAADPRARAMGPSGDLFGRRKDGSEFPLEANLGPLELQTGLFISATIQDITARKRSEELFRLLLERAPDAMVIVDGQGVIALANRRAETVFGYQRAEMIGQPIELLIPERFRELHIELRNAYMEAPEARSMGANSELFARRKDASEFPVEISLGPLRFEAGLFIAATIQDITERKRAQEELQRSREYLDSVLNAIPDPVFVKDVEHRWVLMNDAFCAMMGRPREELLGKSDDYLVPQEVFKVFWEQDELVFKTGHSVHEESVLWKGEKRLVETSKSRFVDSTTGQPFLVAAIRDISERKRAQEELKRSKEQLDKILNTIPDPVFVKDEQHRFIFLNDAFCEQVEAPRDAWLGKTVHDFFPPDIADVFWQGDQAAFDQGSSFQEETTLWRSQPRMIETRKARFADPATGLPRLLGTFRDITERKRAQDELRQSSEFLQNVLNAIPDPVIVKDDAFRILMVNNATIEQTARSRAELIGKTARELFPPEVADRFQREDQEALASGSASSEMVAPWGGGQRYIDVRKSRFKDSVSGRVLLISTNRDITERKRAEEALRSSEDWLRRAVENLPFPAAIAAEDGEIIHISKAWLEISGYTHGEIGSLSDWHRLAYGRSREEILAELGRKTAYKSRSGAIRYGEFRVHAKNGEELIWDFHGAALGKLPDGRALAISVASDVTARKRAEEALRVSEERLRRAVETAPFPAVIHAEDGEILHMSLAWTQLSGYAREEISTIANWTEKAYGQRQEFVQADIERLYGMESQVAEGEYVIQTKSGEQRVWEFHSAALGRLPDGRRIVMSMASDVTDRKRAEEAVRESEEFARSTVNALSAHIAILDANGRILAVNEAWRRFAAENKLANSQAPCVCEEANYLEVCVEAERRGCDEAGEFLQGLLAVLSGQRDSFEMEYTCHSPEENRWFAGRVTRFAGEGPRRAVVAHENISTRKKAEEEVRASEERLRRAIADSPFPEMIYAEDGEILHVSSAWLELSGYSLEDIPNVRVWVEKSHPNDAPEVMKLIEGLFSLERKIHKGEYAIQTKQGVERVWDFHAAPLGKLPDGRRLMLNKAADVTELRRLLGQMEEQKALLELILDSIGEGVVVANAQSQFIMFNPAAYALMSQGVARQETTSKEWTQKAGIFYPDRETHVPKTEMPLAKAIQGESVDGFEVVAINAAAPEGVYLEVAARPLLGAQGELRGGVMVFRDISQRKRAEEAIRQSEVHFRTLSEASPQIVWTASPDGLAEYFNSRWTDLTGMMGQEILGTGWTQAAHPDDLAASFPKWRHSLATGETYESEVRYRRASDGAWVWHLERALPLRDEGGRIEKWFGVSIDIDAQKRAEKALRESEARFRTLAEAAPQIVWIASPDGDAEYFNSRWFDLTGLELEQSLGWGWTRALHPRDQEAFLARWRHCLVTGEKFEFEARFRRALPGGAEEPRWHLARALPARDEKGDIEKWFGVLVDIHGQKRAEEALRVSEERFDLAARGAGDGIWDWSLPSGRLWVSDRFAELLGFESGQFGRSMKVWDELFHPADRAEAQEALRLHLETGAPYDAEYRLRRADGSWRWFRARGQAIWSDAGKPVRMCGSLTDVEGRKLAEKRLRQQIGRLYLLHNITRSIGERHDLASVFRVALKHLEDQLPADFTLIALMDATGDRLTVSVSAPSDPELAKRLKLQEGEKIVIAESGLDGSIQGQILYEPHADKTKNGLFSRLALEGGLRSVAATPLGGRDGTLGILVAARRESNAFSSGECEFLRHLSEHVSLAVAQMRLRGQLQAAYDDLRATQKAITQQERLRAMGQMASGIAHDINNALGPVSLYAEMLLDRETGLSPDGKRRVERIVKSAEAIAQTVARMRQFYRKREDEEVLEFSDLAQIAHEALELTRPRWRDIPQQRGVSIEARVEAEPNLPAIRGVSSEIRDALTNLIFNAVDALPEGGEIRIQVRRQGRHILLEVSDNGMGMDEITLARCMEPFFTTKRELGTGLGLPMVYGMAQRHGALFEMESKVGEGSTARLRFIAPATSLEALAPALSPSAERPILRVLCVDDDPMIRESVGEMLREDGHLTELADGGQAGVEAFQAALKRGEPFHVVITDLGMPRMDGREVAAAIKRESPGTPIIMLTGWGTMMSMEGEAPARVDFLLGKPPRLRELRETLVRAAAFKPSPEPPAVS